MKRLEIRVEGEAYKGKRFSVPPEGLRLGRSSMNDITIRDEELSRNHCLFEPLGEAGVRVTDLASANGTFLNEQRLGAEAVELKAGDVIRVGSAYLTVVGEEDKPIEFDLGLGQPTVVREAAAEPGKDRRRSPFANVLWGVAIVALAVAVYLMLLSPEEAAKTVEVTAETPPELVEMRYEKVAADSESIFRYHLGLTADGVLHAAIDDLSGEGRHINRSAPLGEASKKRLLEILSDEGFAALDREYVGPDEEPPKLNSWILSYCTTSKRKGVRIVNVPEPDAFRRVREKLEAFSMNELGIRALQYSREKLLEMAHVAASTGQMKWEDRDVEYGNLHASICAYREALADLETVNPKPPEFEQYSTALRQSTDELEVRYRNQRFAAEQATSIGDWEKAKQELRTLCEMIPDREDERNREASAKLLDVEKRLGKKGGRK